MRALALVLLTAAAAQAQDLRDRFNIKVSLTGMYMAEQDNGNAQNNEASPFQLGLADLRVVMDARRLPGKFELHLDARVRLTGQFSTDAATTGANQVTARGYLGGREYDVRQIWVARRGEKVDFALGRLIVGEADALKIDGGRLWWRPAKHWDLSAFAGAYPDPYSRSVLTDYGAKSNELGYGFAFAGGVDTTYTYDRVWGSASVVGAYLGGKDDGGPFNPAALPSLGNPQTEGARAYLTWTSFERFTSWLDVYHDLVVDFVGAAGPQLTRLDIFATARAPRYFSFRLGYDHLSAIAIEMYLTRLLADRAQFLAGTIENNLVVNRTARDEGRANIDFTAGKFSAFGEGRVRRRAIVNPQDDPQFLNAGQQVAPDLAYDVTLGVRDRGSLKNIRASLWYTYIRDYRARNHILSLEVGRSFLDERLSLDVLFMYANTRDDQAGQAAACDPRNAIPTTNAVCWGTRDGNDFEVGLTLSGLAWKHWFGLFDYRVLIDTMQTTSAIVTHLLLLRIEARY
jgi:hypothetical protein